MDGDAQYLAILDEMRALHVRKAADYGRDADPLANIRASEQIGIPAWKAAWLRAKDKVHRIDTFCLKGTLANEGVEDSFLDLAAYALIALRLFRENPAPDEATRLRALNESLASRVADQSELLTRKAEKNGEASTHP